MSVAEGITKAPRAKKKKKTSLATVLFNSRTTGPAAKATYVPYLTGAVKLFYDLTSYLERVECAVARHSLF